jgi:hypothetical protein
MSLFRERERVCVYGVCRVKICKLEGVGAKAGSGLKFYCREFLLEVGLRSASASASTACGLLMFVPLLSSELISSQTFRAPTAG